MHVRLPPLGDAQRGGGARAAAERPATRTAPKGRVTVKIKNQILTIDRTHSSREVAARLRARLAELAAAGQPADQHLAWTLAEVEAALEEKAKPAALEEKAERPKKRRKKAT